MINKIKEIALNTDGVNDFIYNDKFKANISLDKSCYPCVLATLIPEWNINIKNFVKEKATIQLFVMVECPHDFDGFEITPDIDLCKNIFMNIIAQMRETYRMGDEIKLTPVYDIFDNGNCGVMAELEIEARQARCLSSYGINTDRIFDRTFDNTFN